MKSDTPSFKPKYAVWALGGTLLLLAVALVGCPQYKVYKKTQDGKAALEEAKQDRQIAIEEAQANLESEKLNSQAEVERAKGVAASIDIEGGKLTDRYLQYLWVKGQAAHDGGETIYIPTEGNLPLLESNPNFRDTP